MHVPSGFCALTVSIFEEHDYKLHCYSGEIVMDEFYNYMCVITIIINPRK